MKKIKKLTSLFMALIMILMLMPLSAMADAQNIHMTKVMIHKILMDKEELNKVEAGKAKWPKDHDGKKITSITDYFGEKAKAINGVAFRVYEVYTGAETTPAGYTKGSDLKVSDKLSTNDLEDGKSYKLIKFAENGTVSTNDGKEFILSKTNNGESGIAEVTLSDGTYRVVEDKQNSTYKGVNGETLTDMKAVPFDLILPAGLPDGSGNYDIANPLHVYPKNIEEKVKFDKNFVKNNNLEKITDNENIKDDGAKAENYKRTKANVKGEIGKEIPYEAKAFLPKGGVFNSLYLEDSMDRGLEYIVNSLQIDASHLTLVNNDYTITNVGNGFKLNFTDEGLKKINKQAEAENVTITFTYKAKVTAEAIDDKPMDNNITINYNHKPPKPSSSEKIKPKNKNIIVEKKWAAGGDAPDGLRVKYLLLDENDRTIADVTFTGKNQVDDTNLGNGISFEVKNDKDYSGTFKGLDNTKDYKIKEIVDGYEADFTLDAGNGKVSITNTKNPTSITPTPPQVTTGGKKFVKTDKNGTDRLVGAEFVIQNKNDASGNNGKYLKLSETNTNGYQDAENKYQEAIKKINEALAKGEISANNKAQIDGQEYTDKAQALGKINELKESRDKAFVKAKLAYTWVADKQTATKFYSNGDGQFAVTGLAYGEYQAVETKAPVGYALPSNGGSFTFTVNKDSKTTDDCDIAYEKNTNGNNAKKIINNKVSIPQTGGIGTLIFTLVGITLMLGAVIAMKRRKTEE